MQIFDLLNINTNMTPTPSSFNNGLSLYEDISKMIYLVNQMIQAVNDNTEESVNLKKQYENVLLELKAIKANFDKYTKGDFIPDHSVDFSKLSDNVLSEINTYIESYMYNFHNFVSFGLEDGHFVAYIPETWKDINFSSTDEGHLVLEF